MVDPNSERSGTAFREELSRIREVLARPTPARGRVLVVHGAEGTGQAELVSELIRSVSDDGQVVLQGSCADGPAGPYRPFQPILQAVSSLRGAHRPTTGPTPLAALRASGGPRDLRLNHLEGIRRALCDLAASRPTLLVVHDLHQADDDTLALVEYLLEDAVAHRGVAGIGSAWSPRPTYLFTLDDDGPAGRAVLDRLLSREAAEAVAVRRLDEEGLAAVVVEEGIAEKLLRVTGGMPHRVRALVEMLPDDLCALLRARVAELGQDALATLKLARTLDRPIAPGSLAVLAGVPRPVVEQLRTDGLLVEAGAGEVALSEAFAGASAVDPETPAERRDLHRRCAEHLEARLAVTGDDALRERLVDHLLAAGEPDRAVDHALAAGRWLRQSGALRAAVVLLERCVRAAPAAPAPLLRELVELDTELGRLDRALARCQALAAGGDATASFEQARLHHLRGDLEGAAEALEGLRTHDLPDELAGRVVAELAHIRLRQGDPDAAAVLCDAHPAEGELAYRLRHLGARIHLARGEFAEAERDLRALIEALGADGGRLRGVLLHDLGRISLRTGRYEEAGHRLSLALAAYEERGDYVEAAVCRHHLALAHRRGQRYGLALRELEQAIEALGRFRSPADLGEAICALAELYLLLGEVWRARRLLDHVRELASTQALDRAALLLGRACLADGEHEEAAAWAARAGAAGHAAHLLAAEVALAGDTPARQHIDAALAAADPEVRARARVLDAVERCEEAPSQAHSAALEAADHLRRQGARDGVVDALVAAANAALAGGQRSEARLLVEQAAAALDELRARIPAEHREAFEATPRVARVEAARAEVEALPVPEAAPEAAARPQRRGDTFRGIVGRSMEMTRVFDLVERLYDCSAPILIVGESGTGKELVAEAIRAGSTRAGKPFVRVNAAAFAEALLESGLFGHEKGAFTGAVARKPGAFEQADGGTLFLDEIGDISPRTQVSLLRVLQEGELRRVGGRTAIRVDVRVLCATNRDLEALVEHGRFRLDLYYRIKGVTVELPPLRTRGDDVLLIADAFLARIAGEHGRALRLSDDARSLMRRYAWPGNVRELENVLRSVYFFAQDDEITAADLTSYTILRDVDAGDMVTGRHLLESDAPLGEGFDLNDAKRDLEIQCIERALAQTDGNITQAAKLLGLKRPRLSQKIKEYGLKD